MLIGQIDTGEGQRLQIRRIHAHVQFFAQLADQRELGRLTRFDLATGKFPEPCQRLSLRSLLDEYPPVIVHEARGDDEQQGFCNGLFRHSVTLSLYRWFEWTRPGGVADMIVGLIKRLLADRTAGTAIEYGLIAALVVIAMIAALMQLANVTTGIWNRVGVAVTAVPVT